MPIAALAAMIPSIVQMIAASSQRKEARDLEGRYSRPYFQVPQGMMEALDLNKNFALQTELPRQDLIEQKLDETISGAMADFKRSATSPWEITSAANKLAEAKSEKVKDLGIAGAELGIQTRRDYTGLLGELSKMQEKQFMYNDYSPYLAAMDAIRNLRGAGLQNLYGGVSNISGVIANNPDIFKDIFPNTGVGAAKNELEGMMTQMQSSLAYKPPTEY